MIDAIKFKGLINQAMDKHDVPFIDRPMVLGAATATVVSRLTSVPTEAIDNLRIYLLSNENNELDRAISLINETSVINAIHTKELAISLWKLRYYAAHPKCIAQTDLRYGFVDSLVNTAECLSAKDHEFLNKYKEEIAFITPFVLKLIEE